MCPGSGGNRRQNQMADGPTADRRRELCNPWNICFDKDHSVYVADYGQDKLHVLPIENGTLLSSINLPECGIMTPFFARVQLKLYIAHRNIKDENIYQISEVNVQQL